MDILQIFLIHWPSASPPPCPDRLSAFCHSCAEHCCVEHYHHSHHSVCYVLLVVLCCSLYPQQVQTKMKQFDKKTFENKKKSIRIDEKSSLIYVLGLSSELPLVTLKSKTDQKSFRIEAWGFLGQSWPQDSFGQQK